MKKVQRSDEAKVGFVFASFLFEFSHSTLNVAAVTYSRLLTEFSCSILSGLLFKFSRSYIMATQAPFKVEQVNSNKKLENEKLASAS